MGSHRREPLPINGYVEEGEEEERVMVGGWVGPASLGRREEWSLGCGSKRREVEWETHYEPSLVWRRFGVASPSMFLPTTASTNDGTWDLLLRGLPTAIVSTRG